MHYCTKTARTLLILFSVVLLLSACAKEASEKSDENTIAKTAETKTVVDHAGNIVEIPVDPQRIASLADGDITLPLLELDANIIGTYTRTMPNGSSILGSAEQFNIAFSDTNFVDYGTNDIEKIKASKPDLIIGLVGYDAKNYPLLSSIAPTVLLNFNNNKNYTDLAIWIGKEEKYNELLQQYKKRLKEVKAKFTVPPENNKAQFIWINPEDTVFYIYYNFSIAYVLEDMGFKNTTFAQNNYVEKWGEPYSLEVLGDILKEADYLFIGWGAIWDETSQTPFNTLDIVMPNWKKITKAYKNNTLINMQWDKGGPATFQSLYYTLDLLEKYAK